MIENKKIPKSVWYGLDGKGYDNIAQELATEDQSARKWISIYAIYKYEFSEDQNQYFNFIHNSKKSRYAVIIFTVPTEMLETSDGIDDRDITMIDIKNMDSEDDILKYLTSININPELFTPPWKCNYPL